MRRCRTCHRLLDESNFYKENRRKDGLQVECKDCTRVRVKRIYRDKILCGKRPTGATGGYKCYILNHTSHGEFKYNVVGTNGKTFFTNKKTDFIKFVRGIV